MIYHHLQSPTHQRSSSIRNLHQGINLTQKYGNATEQDHCQPFIKNQIPIMHRVGSAKKLTITTNGQSNIGTSFGKELPDGLKKSANRILVDRREKQGSLGNSRLYEQNIYNQQNCIHNHQPTTIIKTPDLDPRQNTSLEFVITQLKAQCQQQIQKVIQQANENNCLLNQQIKTLENKLAQNSKQIEIKSKQIKSLIEQKESANKIAKNTKNHQYLSQKLDDLQKKITILLEMQLKNDSDIDAKIDSLKEKVINQFGYQLNKTKQALSLYLQINSFKILHLETALSQKAANQAESNLQTESRLNCSGEFCISQDSHTRESVSSSYWEKMEDVSFSVNHQEASFSEDYFFHPTPSQNEILQSHLPGNKDTNIFMKPQFTDSKKWKPAYPYF